MTDPGSLPGRSTAFISGNDADAKRIATDLHEALGWRREEVMDLGPIQQALAQERYFSLFMAIYGATGAPQFNIAVVRG
jgi:predicted dinucleotide-binding enzyme